MKLKKCLSLSLLLLLVAIVSGGGGRAKDAVVCLKRDLSDSADQIALERGFRSQGEVIAGSGCYHFFIDKDAGATPAGSRVSRKERLKVLASDPRVSSVTKQGSNKRQKRGFMPLFDPEGARQTSGQGLIREKRGFFSTKSDPVVTWTPPSDPYWKHMWYLNGEGKLNMNVQGAWDQGISGRGVAVTILDDGIEKDHPDLIENYDPLASTDINDNDSDPNPRYDFSDSNRHGTRCAGQVIKPLKCILAS